MSQKSREIEALIAPAVASLGLELLGSEWSAGPSRSLLRLYIEAPQRPVSVEDCEAVSREVEALLDVHDPISGEYTLEVSSPGIDRPLFTPAQFARHAGENAKVTLKLPLDGRRRMQGRIVRVEPAQHAGAGDAGAPAGAGTTDFGAAGAGSEGADSRGPGTIVLEIEGAELALPFDAIEKARIVPDLVALGLAPKTGGRPSPKRGGAKRRKS